MKKLLQALGILTVLFTTGLALASGDSGTSPFALLGLPNIWTAAQTHQGAEVFSNASTNFSNGVEIGGVAATRLVNGSVFTATSGSTNTWLVPAAAKRITVSMENVTLSGSDNYLFQLGTGGALVTTGYVSLGATIGVSSLTSTAGIISRAAAHSSVTTMTIIFTLVDPATNTWEVDGNGTIEGGFAIMCAGRVSLAGTIDRIAILQDGSSTFSSGKVNVMYEY